MTNHKNILLALLLLIVALPSLAQRTTISLAGTWQFATDPQGMLKPDSRLDDTILLPGSMLERDKGDRPDVHTRWTGSLYDSSYFYNPYMAKYRTEQNFKLPFFLTPGRHYVGDAWYRTTVSVPADYKDKQVYVFLEHPHITTTLFVNGKEVGSQNSLSVAHRYDVTRFVKPGATATLCIRVNNDADRVGVGQDSHSVTDQTQGNWNGLTGRLELQAVPRTHIEHVDVYPDVVRKCVKVKVKIVRGSKGDKGLYWVNALYRTREQEAQGKGGFLTMQQVRLTDDTTLVELTSQPNPKMLLWDEFHPNLYVMNCTLKDEKNVPVDRQQTTFGCRSITTKDKDILVNGRPVRLRGTVENCDFPLTGYAPNDKASWRQVFEQCKRYGLNHMRFHSFCPPEAAFEAADELGFYLQPEGPSWPNHGIKLGNGMMIDTYLWAETQRMVERYGNHPSFTMLSSGNEPAGHWVAWVSKFVDYWKKNDPRRIYTGASVGGSWAWQPRNQYHVKAGARGLDWNKVRPNSMTDFSMQIDTVSQPFVSHETGQWCAFPDLAETSQYTGVYKARNFEIFADILRDHGMESRAKAFLKASGQLQVLCYKNEMEKMMRTPHYAGYQLLGLNDYSGQGTALVGPLNVFWREKGYVTADEWREFCSPITLLMRLPRFTFFSGEDIPFALEVSNADEGPITQAAIQVTFTDDTGKVVSSLDLDATKDTIPLGLYKGLNEYPNAAYTNTITTDLARRYTVRAVLSGRVGEKPVESMNEWHVWVFPRHSVAEMEKLQQTKNLYVATDAADPRVAETLSSGGKVLLLAGKKLTYGRGIVQQFTPVFWNTSWFKMKPPHTTGMFIDQSHPLFKHFPTTDFSDLQWWSLMNRQPVMLMDRLPLAFQPVIQPIDTWFLSRKLGMLFEACVGKGKLLVTTMPLEEGMTRPNDDKMPQGSNGKSAHGSGKDDPVVQQMRYAILKYMNSSDFAPAQSLPMERISELFTLQTPPVNMFTNDSPDELKKGVR